MNNLFSALLPALFQAVLAMSLTAAVTALAVLAIRAVMGALRVPRAIVFLLWAVVLFRMVCPVSFSSSWSLLSLLPAAEEQSADLPGGYGDSHSAAWDPPQSQGGHQTGASGGGPAPTLAPETGGSAQSSAVSGPAAPSEPAEPAEPGWLPALSAVWALGVLALWLWSLVSWLRLRRRLSAAVRTPDGAWESDRVDSPFVLGFFPPKIYLPLGLSGDTRRYVLLHERAHIRRGDHIVKVLAFLALAVHWFNPLLWVSWFLSCRDMEAACDESVLRRSPEDIRKNYSAALLSLAAAHPLRVPLAFGENGVKGRVRGALRWKRPAAALVAAALVVLLASCYMLAANPAQVPDAAPELTLTVEGSSITLSPETEAPDWDSTPLLTGSTHTSIQLSVPGISPASLEGTDSLLSGAEPAPMSRDLQLREDGSAAFSLSSRSDAGGTGTELRGIVVTARWGSGARALTARYSFRVRMPSVLRGVDREAPAVVAGGQELSLRNSTPFSTLRETQPLVLTDRDAIISLSHPTDAAGYTVELYALNESTYTEIGDPLNQLNVQSVDGNANLASGTAFYLSEDAPGGLLGLRLSYQYPSGVTKSWIGLLELDGGAQAPECVFGDDGLPYLRYPGREELTPLLPLLPAPAEWAGQDMGGRNEAETLADLEASTVQMGFTTASEGWAVVGVGAGVGNADTYFYRTHDGGRTWVEYSHPDSQWYMERAAFSDPDHGVLCEGLFVDAPIYVTSDGGETWRELEISQIYDQAYPEDIPDDALYTVDSLLLCGSWGVLTLSGYGLPPLCVYTSDSWDTFSLLRDGVLPVGDEAAYDAYSLELDEYGTPVLSLFLRNSEDFSMGTVTLQWDGGAWYREVDIGDPAELTAADLPDIPVTTWAEDTGNYAAERTPTRSEILAEYGFDWGDIYYVYYTPLDDTLHLQLWFDPETGKGCGFRYVWEGADGPLAVPDIYAFGFHGATVPTEWEDPYTCGLLGNADAYSVLTPWGTDGSEAVSRLRSDWSYRADGNPEAFHAAGTDESGNPVDVLDVTFSYWDDGPLLSKSYFHNQLLFGTAYLSTQMYYTSHERLAYARCYLTHGSLELFYFYDGDGDTPAYCLMLDNDGGLCFPTLFAY
ncbi:M56 family metallopeptidase [Pseudoflavonifractor capillosus]|uniref:Peptidase M56 domain-containing protein n=1 Tax=Pseudoflavonifractor capillosus TaxID=106588 RepID=A0A921MMB6_9FIRM|nr:M56 family metallopeptidase [Pseudoflavonifractor capillosus]HJG86785.1 hypothetical protein [Pseudoflavonifractor capillosus]